MSDRINEIKSRLDAAAWRKEWEVGWDARSEIVGVRGGDFDDADLIAHAPADIEYLLSEIKWQQSVMEQEVFELRDEINALWDVVWSLIGEDRIDEISALFLERVAAQKEMRVGNIDIETLGKKYLKERREALEQLAKMSEELPGGYLGDTK